MKSPSIQFILCNANLPEDLDNLFYSMFKKFNPNVFNVFAKCMWEIGPLPFYGNILDLISLLNGTKNPQKTLFTNCSNICTQRCKSHTL